MKYLLAAALTVIALASPVRSEVIEIQCMHQSGAISVYQFDMGQETVSKMGSADYGNTRVLLWNDYVIGWTTIVDDEQSSMLLTRLLDRKTLMLQYTPLVNLSWEARAFDEHIQCVNSL